MKFHELQSRIIESDDPERTEALRIIGDIYQRCEDFQVELHDMGYLISKPFSISRPGSFNLIIPFDTNRDFNDGVGLKKPYKSEHVRDTITNVKELAKEYGLEVTDRLGFIRINSNSFLLKDFDFKEDPDKFYYYLEVDSKDVPDSKYWSDGKKVNDLTEGDDPKTHYVKSKYQSPEKKPDVDRVLVYIPFRRLHYWFMTTVTSKEEAIKNAKYYLVKKFYGDNPIKFKTNVNKLMTEYSPKFYVGDEIYQDLWDSARPLREENENVHKFSMINEHAPKDEIYSSRKRAWEDFKTEISDYEYEIITDVNKTSDPSNFTRSDNMDTKFWVSVPKNNERDIRIFSEIAKEYTNVNNSYIDIHIIDRTANNGEYIDVMFFVYDNLNEEETIHDPKPDSTLREEKLELNDGGYFTTYTNDNFELVGGMRSGNSPRGQTRLKYLVLPKDILRSFPDGTDQETLFNAANIGYVELFVKDSSHEIMGLVNILFNTKNRKGGYGRRVT